MLNRLEYLKIFCVVAEHRTFKDAAIKLNVSPQVITRCIKDLEQELGEILFIRSTRNIKISSFGEQFYAKAKSALTILDGVFAKPSPDSLTVKITAPPTLSKRFIMPLLTQISQEHPEIHFDLRLSNTISDVVEEKIDIGIRVGSQITDNRFIARPVTKMNHVVVGSPALIAKYGIPQTPDDLHNVPTTALFDNDRNQVWYWGFKDGYRITPALPAFTTDDSEAELDAVLGGLGFSQLAVSMVAPYIKSGALIPVLNDFAEHDMWDIYIYRPQSGPVPPRIRIVYDTLVTHFSDPDFFPMGFTLPEQGTASINH